MHSDHTLSLLKIKQELNSLFLLKFKIPVIAHMILLPLTSPSSLLPFPLSLAVPTTLVFLLSLHHTNLLSFSELLLCFLLWETTPATPVFHIAVYLPFKSLFECHFLKNPSLIILHTHTTVTLTWYMRKSYSIMVFYFLYSIHLNYTICLFI